MVNAKSTQGPPLSAFEREIARQEGLLYGVALYFECLSHLLAGQDAVVETHRKEFRNVIRDGHDRIQKARALLEAARSDAGRLPEVAAFRFSPGGGHARAEDLVRRAEILVETYDALFPGRPRERDFEPGEVHRLMTEAARRLA